MSRFTAHPILRRYSRPLVLTAGAAVVAINALGPSSGGTRPAGPATTHELDTWFDSQMRDAGVPGAAMVVVRDGRVVDTHVYGVADDAGNPITPSTPFVIGSLTKSMTALAILQLVDAGKVTLDATLATSLPESGIGQAPGTSAITIRQLLDQTSGFSTADGLAPLSTPATSLDQRVDQLAKATLVSPPGETYHYSNANYLVLGRVVEVASEMPFADYLHAHVFDTIGMADATASNLPSGVTMAHRLWFGRAPSNQPLWRADMVPAGFVSSSADDLARYLLAQLGEIPAGVTQASLDAMHQGVAATGLPDQRYGFGWVDGKLGDARIVSHSGSTTDMASIAVLVPARHLAVAIVMNATTTLYETLHKPDTIGLATTALLLGQDPPGTIQLLYPAFSLLSLAIVAIIAYGITRQVRAQRRPAHASQVVAPGTRSARAKGVVVLGYRLYVDIVVPLAIVVLAPASFATDWSVMARIDIGQVLLVIAALRVIDGVVRLRGWLAGRRMAGATSTEGSASTAEASAG